MGQPQRWPQKKRGLRRSNICKFITSICDFSKHNRGSSETFLGTFLLYRQYREAYRVCWGGGGEEGGLSKAQ